MSEAFNRALHLLTRREHGALELSVKLKQKGFSYEEAAHALEKCQDLDLQSDRRFVENYIHSRRNQGYGPVKISHELKIKGIDKQLIAQILEQETYWLDAAVKVWEKKSKGSKELSFQDIRKLQAFLQYRGFDGGIIAEVVALCAGG